MAEYKDLQTAGKMDSSFFVSRKELIEWVNRYLKLNITKVEQCSNGAIYIQLLDILFPNKSVLHKAKWNAKMEYECIINYKLIQSVFNKLGIKKYMDVDKLIKGKYQDNFEFLQWFKSFFERIIDYNNEQVINYDPIERRKLCLLGERGDYKQLNNYLPEWAKTDINVLKEKKYIYSDNNIGTNLNKTKNLEHRDSVNREISIGCGKGTSRGMNSNIVNNNINNNVNNSANININNNSVSNNVNNYINSNLYSAVTSSTTTSSNNNNNNNNNNNYNNINKFVKSEKGTMHINLNNDHNNNIINSNNNTSLLSSNNDININIHKNKNTSNHHNNNVNKRLSLSNNIFSQGSLSHYHNKAKILESQKDYNSLMDQNKKLKTQLENKNQELLLIQNKLKEEENEKKILHFQKNFYYNKLRFLELLCNQTDDSYILIHDIQQIIYARDNTYFHHTVSLKDKNNTEDNESIEPNNTNELSLQHTIPHNESLTYNTQGSIDYATYCS
ncbi:EB1 homolog, putative [Plasmodium sp. gorilla clade G2]|uniref:EB1 homolog, putative n=1 Tax=Plasmodium sp. gorilla clade G2 TaxID=880535 RepID=UPI000D212DB7|nr:EB1 homolog, putative [Plasmodium sp. gorilla clade G2]SOV10764.1 EB1 homolog, putative [Plasmodium sp. gorilla clade G2]